MVTRYMLIERLTALRQGTVSSDDVANWAAQIHWQYENGTLAFESGYEQVMFTTLIDLVHNEGVEFRLDGHELQHLIAVLESSSAIE